MQERTAWAPPALAAWQPRFAYRLVDVSRFAGDHAADGNMARAVHALDAAAGGDVAAALGRVAELLGEADDPSLSHAFELWYRGVLAPRFGDGLPLWTSLMEEPTMLAETLRKWEEHKINEGLQRGREEGLQQGMERGREEERKLLRSLAARRFGGATAEAIWPLLGSMHDTALLAEVGALIVECKTGADLLEDARGLVEPNSHRA